MITLLIITLCIVIIDLVIKLFIVNNFILYESIEVINNFFYITYTSNYGAAWSILSGKGYISIIIAIIVILYLIYYLKRKKKLAKYEIIGYSLLLGGTIGNLIDRIIYGYVVDYLDFYIFNYNYPIFNIADMAIVIGVIIILIFGMRGSKNDN